MMGRLVAGGDEPSLSDVEETPNNRLPVRLGFVSDIAASRCRLKGILGSIHPPKSPSSFACRRCQNLCRGAPHCTQNRKQSEMAVADDRCSVPVRTCSSRHDLILAAAVEAGAI